MMDHKHNPTEDGQAMILLLLALAGIFAFAALAIDISVVYSDRRIAQNAADAASMAGVGEAGQEIKDILKAEWDCSSAVVDQACADAESAAELNASVNDYSIDVDISDDNGVQAICVDSDDKYLDVEVKITDQTDTTFAHLLYPGPLMNTVQSIARLRPRYPAADGYSIISLTDECQGDQKGTVIGGSQDVTLTGGGGIFSNSCLILNGSSGTITGDSMYWYNDGGFVDNGQMTVNVPTIEQADDKLYPEIETPDCDAAYPGGVVNPPGGTDVDLPPGYYTKLNVTCANCNLTMSDGLYCFDGAFLFSGNMITATNTTIAMVGDKGFTAAGSGVATMFAPPAKCGVNGYMSGVCPHAIGGLLIWVDPTIKFNVKLTGDADSYFGGTVYHPGGTIEIGGNSTLGSITYGTQLIGDTIKIHGDTDVNIVYDETYYHHNSAKLEVAK